MKLSEIKADTEKRLKYLTEYDEESQPVIKAVLDMEQMACYDLFGMGNTTLEEVEELMRMLSHDLYDDGCLGFSPVSGTSRVTSVPDDHEHILYEDDIIKLVESASRQPDYYAIHGERIEERIPSSVPGIRGFTEEAKKWFVMGREHEALKESLGHTLSKQALESRKRIAEMKASIQERRNEQTVDNK